MKKLKAVITITFEENNAHAVLVMGGVPFSCCLEQLNGLVSKFTEQLIADVHDQAGRTLTEDEFKVAFNNRLDADDRLLKQALKRQIIIQS